MANINSLGDLFGAMTPTSSNSSNSSAGKSQPGILNFLEGLNKPMQGVFNGLGSGIDLLGDLTIGNLIGLADEKAGENFKNSTSGETYSFIPSMAADALTWLLPGGVPLKLGLLGLKGLAESSPNIKEAVTGTDSETGRKLSGAEQAGAGLMGALNTALTVLPGAPLAKAVEKQAAKAISKKAEKEAFGSALSDLSKAEEAAKAMPTKEDLIAEKFGGVNKADANIALPGKKQSELDAALPGIEKEAKRGEAAVSNLRTALENSLKGDLSGQDVAPKILGQNWELVGDKIDDLAMVPTQAAKKRADVAAALSNEGFFPTGSALSMRRLANSEPNKKGIRNAIKNMAKTPKEPELPAAGTKPNFEFSIDDLLPEGYTLKDFGLAKDATAEDLYKAIIGPQAAKKAGAKAGKGSKKSGKKSKKQE